MPATALNPDALAAFVSNKWDEEIVPQPGRLHPHPGKSPHFDPQWESNGHIEAAVKLAEAWCRAQNVPGIRLEVVRLPGRTPLLFFEIPGDSDRTVLLYGHLDKQPEMVGWREGGGPWDPVMEDGMLYGRGGADDGYAVFAALTAILGAARAGHPACALRGHDRVLRGERQLRPAGLPRSAQRPRRQGRSGDRPRFGLRQLRSAVGDDIAARVGCRHTHRRSAHRGRALGRCQRRGAVVVSYCAPVARPHRGLEDRTHPACRVPLPDPARSASSRPAGGRHSRRHDLDQVSRSPAARGRW